MNKPTAVFFVSFAFVLGGFIGVWGVSNFWGRLNLDSSVSSKSANVSLTTRTLELIRTGNTPGAVELLEVNLDGSLSVMGEIMSSTPPSRRDPLDIEALQSAKDYRTRFPRTNETFRMAVDKAFSLLTGPK